MMHRENALLLLIDFQTRLMPAIADGAFLLGNARRLLDAAAILRVPLRYTEQYPKGLGHTVPELAPLDPAGVFEKRTFAATLAPGFFDFLGDKQQDIVVAGCEAHVCVLQTVLGLLAAGYKVRVVADATGSRTAANKQTAMDRMRVKGADIVTTEMVLFEWLESADHPEFRRLSALIKNA